MKRIAILIALVIALGASACTGDRELVCTSGTQGISAEFVNFPENTQQGIATPIVVELENNGAYTSKQVYAWLRYGRDFFKVTEAEVTKTDFEGRAPWNKCSPQVRRDQYIVEPYDLPFGSTSFERPLAIDLCYHYSNNLTTNLCVDPLQGSINALEPNCVPSDRRFAGGQGSPVGITRVEAPVIIDDGGKSIVRIGVHLENFGDGIILAYKDPNEPLESCTYQNETYKDHVFFKAFLDNELLDCAKIESPGTTVANKSFLRYDPEVIETDNGRTTLDKYYLFCESDPLELNSELLMTFNVEMHYYYRDTRADERVTTIRKI